MKTKSKAAAYFDVPAMNQQAIASQFKEFRTEVADAIRAKKGTTELIHPQDFAEEIASIETGGSLKRHTYTGHADVEGLRAIGWTDEDIAYYQENGVNWDEEDDQYHLVSEDNKALYGVLTENNISEYKARIVYLPKIDTSNVTDMNKKFYGCPSLVSIPQLDTSNVTTTYEMFGGCSSLVSVTLLDTQKVTNIGYMLNGCTSLTTANLKNVKLACQLQSSALLSKESLLYLINNEAATSAITIKLASYAYERLATDPDIVAALENHPNISISK